MNSRPTAKNSCRGKTNDLFVIDAAARPSGPLDKLKVNLTALKFSFMPRESWRQMFTDAWRLHRDYFYDSAMHGVDWHANLAKHLPLVDRVTDRAELNDVLTYMMSELSSLHTALVPGDVRTGPEDDSISVASLGARLARDEKRGGWRVEHIYTGDPDYPANLSPLARPGQRVANGDIIESINGVPTLSVPDAESLLRNQTGHQVLLHVKASGRMVQPSTRSSFRSQRGRCRQSPLHRLGNFPPAPRRSGLR